MVTNLKSWLRRMPQPHGIRYVTPDDEERELQLSSNARNRWKDAADALEEMGAVRVEALDKEGKVLRVAQLRDEDGGELHDATERQDRAKAKELVGLASVLDAQGRRISEAYREGAEAASRGQDNLVQVVNILTAQWTATMQSVHNLSQSLARAIRGQGGGDEEHDEVGAGIQQLLGMAAMRMMGMGMPGMGGDAPAPDTKKNGAAKPKEK
jgi:hypothetical protein